MNTVWIPLDPISPLFKKHLDEADNKRIIFSASFGTGKSTFIRSFAENETAYYWLNVYPVNYSVAQNQDIFELIKYDIVVELISKYQDEIKFEKEDFSFLLKSQVFVNERVKWLPIINAIIGLNESIGKTAVPILTLLNDLVKDFGDFQKSVEVDEKQQLINYLNQSERQQGSINEFDHTSRLIKTLLTRLQGEAEKKNPTVLVIDDLDRLDPEHVFRLLNVFSAHYDSATEMNKFGFDKVVMVCDVENIRRIFHNRYGQDVDFSGYIDKFYSSEIFFFDSGAYLASEVKNIVRKFPVMNKEDLGREGNIVFYMLEWLVICFVKTNLINFRNLFKYPQTAVPTSSFVITEPHGKYRPNHYPILSFFSLAERLFPSRDIFAAKLAALDEKLSSSGLMMDIFSYDDFRNIPEHVIANCLPFVLLKEGSFDPLQKDEPEKRAFWPGKDLVIAYKRSKDNEYRKLASFQLIKVTETDEQSIPFHELDILDMLVKTYAICKARKIID